MSGVGGGGLSKKNNGGLIKNSIIKCSIDDLQLEEGLIVVSFVHKDNRYQGVLLQLNRERGIPAGISFPKEYFSGEKKSQEIQNPSQTPPLVQRNTYFQETDNGRQYRSLRRVIKTPARFKNSRMSLRPVQRPVLCAKCGALCNDKEKAAGEETIATTKCSNTNDGESPKKNGDSKKSPITATATSNKASTKDKLELTPKVRLSKLSTPNNNDTCPKMEEDPLKADLDYEGVGSFGIIDNAWKRPLSKPLKYQTRHQAKSKQVLSKLIKLPSKIIVANKNSNSHTKCDESESSSGTSQCPVFCITRAPHLKSSDNQKTNNLKLCIKKLTMAQEAKLEMNGEPQEESPSLQQQPKIEGHLHYHSSRKRLSVPPMKIPIRKVKLKRRNSTMPSYHFRDKSKNSPTWRTRKISTMSNPDDAAVMSPVADGEFCDPLNFKKDRVGENEGQQGTVRVDPSEEESPAPSGYMEDELHPLLSNDLSPIQSPEQFEESDSEISAPLINKPEPAKTPVIKITFGSSGKGVVVEIPPRNTNQHKSEESSIISELDAKAKSVRKALKKARKEAKRKQSEKALLMLKESISVSPSSSSGRYCPVLEPSTTPPSPTKPALTPLTIHLNSSSHKFSTSPVRPNSLNLALAELPPSLHLASPTTGESAIIDIEGGERFAKKKKKAKKRKRQKDHKENDLELMNRLNSGEIHYNQNQGLLMTTSTIVPSLEPSSLNLKSEISNNIPPTLKTPMISSSPNRHSISPNNPKDGNSPSPALTPGTPLEITTEIPTNRQRVCISLKRLKNQTNAYIPWNSSGNNCFSSDEHGTTSDSEEPHDFQDATFQLSGDESGDGQLLGESTESYNHIQSNHQYKKGDVVWGKSTGCPWWPGKIADIHLRGVNDARAKIAWYKSATQSYIHFADLHPFEEYFDTKYTKNRKRGCYQQAVREALIDAHQMNLQDYSH